MLIKLAKTLYWKLDFLYENYFYWPFFRLKRKHHQIEQFKDKHKGQRCFLIGNGPSLKIADLELLQNEVTFAVNRIHDIYSKTSWRPTYYCAVDRTVIKSDTMEIHTSQSETKANFFSYNSDIRNAKMLFAFKQKLAKNSYCFYRTTQKKGENPVFSQDASKCVIAGGSVLNEVLQIAVYMGFSEIYYLGVDFNYVPDKTTNREDFQYYAEGIRTHRKLYTEDINYRIANTEGYHLWFSEARKFCEKKGVKIVNATRGGKLDFFERVDFDKLMSNC